jgi:Nitrate and nitrite sensing
VFRNAPVRSKLIVMLIGPLLADKRTYGSNELGRLPEQRRAVDSLPITRADRAVEPSIEVAEQEGEEHLDRGHGPIDTPGKALDQYTDTVNDLLDINAEIAPGAGDERLLQAVAASVALARAKDFADLQPGLLTLPPELAGGQAGQAPATAGQLEHAGLGPDWSDQLVPMTHFRLRPQPVPPAPERGRG